MVKPRGWGGVKPYWWCDTHLMRSVLNHITTYLPEPHPMNGIYIQGTDKFKPESIILNCIIDSNYININSNTANIILLNSWVDSIKLIMDQSLIADAYFNFNSEEHFNNKHTYNLQYKWQHQDKKLRHLEP